ncbi:Metallo-dependent phosphatase-like protein [Mycena galopus ATCC 62051]|nr:Metallo-dependent phosphatase-like protein [Mycena galopus ATCC 62051]
MTGPRCTRIVAPSSVVQLKYTGLPLPKPEPTTGKAWTRFVLISDTHGRTFPVPDGDVLLHSGDLTRSGTLNDLRNIMAWLDTLPHPIKIIIGGNRDFLLDREWYDVNWPQTGRHGNEAKWEPPDSVSELLSGPSAVAANIVYLQDQLYTFRARPGGREWSVYGSPRSPYVSPPIRAFSYDQADAEALVAAFPRTDILLTHCPPHDLLDLTNRGDHAGCPALAARLSTLRPRLHVFGHIHEARGAHVHLWAGGDAPSAQNNLQMTKIADVSNQELDLVVEEGEQTVFVNASNYPSGPNASRDSTGQLDGGGVGFQPVVVDLLE